MLRAELLCGTLATIVLPRNGVAGEEACESSASGVTSFRFVVPVGLYRVGLLTNVGAAVIAAPGRNVVVVNLPRPQADQSGWRRSIPPRAPYVNPAWVIDDIVARVYQPAGPDEATLAGVTGPYAVFGFRPSPRVESRSYLLRVNPATATIDTRWVPMRFDGSATAMFFRDGNINFVDQAGNTFEDSSFFAPVSS